ncbi:chaplin [Streptomyces lydicus]|uniref:chaplin n=1 Tax=Streptomyces lydicus TaxID=47763 RepID=UPI0028704A5E|nr:chaplin [Streptomyces lydicus]
MRQSLKTCVLLAAASGALGAGGGVAYADAGAAGATTNSPGVLSGNSIQVSVDTPVNACGNSVDGAAALNPAMGASCGTGGAWPAAQRPPLAPPPPAPHRGAPEPVRHRVPQPAHRPVSRPEPRPDGHRAAPPVEAAHRTAAHPGHREAPHRAAQEPRVGAVERAGASAGSALLASTGADELGMLAGAGGGLLLGGALLLRRARTRRR